MTAAIVSEIAHVATRLQAASMVHAANVREVFSVGDLVKEADQLRQLAERVAYLVGRLQTDIARPAPPALPAGQTIFID